MSGEISFDKVIQLQSQFPDFIKVKINESKDGGYWVEILNVHGCFTQVDNIQELFSMVNDAVYTYFDIPEEYRMQMPRYFPTEKLRKEIQKWDKNIPMETLQKPILFFPAGIRISTTSAL